MLFAYLQYILNKNNFYQVVIFCTFMTDMRTIQPDININTKNYIFKCS